MSAGEFSHVGVTRRMSESVMPTRTNRQQPGPTAPSPVGHKETTSYYEPDSNRVCEEYLREKTLVVIPCLAEDLHLSRDAFQRDMIEALALARIHRVVSVPTSGLDNVYKHLQSRGRCVFATREDEAMAIVAGMTLASAGGSLLLIQQSGIGNLLNTMFTLVESYDIWFPVLVFDRGGADANPIHRLSSRNSFAAVSAIYDTARLDFTDETSVDAFLAALTRQVRWIFTP